MITAEINNIKLEYKDSKWINAETKEVYKSTNLIYTEFTKEIGRAHV